MNLKHIEFEEYVVMFLTIISIIGIIWSWNIITKEVKFIDVTDENREIVKKNFVDGDKIRKIGIGQGFHRHYVYLYYDFGIVKEIYYGEGVRYLRGLEHENEYSLDGVAFGVGISSLVILILTFIYRMNRYKTNN